MGFSVNPPFKLGICDAELVGILIGRSGRKLRGLERCLNVRLSLKRADDITPAHMHIYGWPGVEVLRRCRTLATRPGCGCGNCLAAAVAAAIANIQPIHSSWSSYYPSKYESVYAAISSYPAAPAVLSTVGNFIKRAEEARVACVRRRKAEEAM